MENGITWDEYPKLKWIGEINSEGEINRKSRRREKNRGEQKVRGKRKEERGKRPAQTHCLCTSRPIAMHLPPANPLNPPTFLDAHNISFSPHQPWSSGYVQAEVTMCKPNYTAIAGSSDCKETMIRLLPTSQGSIQDQTWICYIHIHLHYLEIPNLLRFSLWQWGVRLILQECSMWQLVQLWPGSGVPNSNNAWWLLCKQTVQVEKLWWDHYL